MPFHTVAYAESQTNGTTIDVEPVPDDVILIQNGHFVFQESRQLLIAKTNIEDLTFCELVCPTFRQFSPIVPPVNDPNEESVIRAALVDYRQYPPTLPRLEEIQFNSTRAGAAALNSFAILACQLGGMERVPAGQVYTMRGTGTGTAVALRWTTIVTAWANTLPTGRYAVCALQVQSTTSVAARLIFENQQDRPGVPSTTSFNTISHPALEVGGMGVFGRFDSWAMPQIQVLCEAADTAYDVRMSFVRVQ
jgi:hypothetical protein